MLFASKKKSKRHVGRSRFIGESLENRNLMTGVTDELSAPSEATTAETCIACTADDLDLDSDLDNDSNVDTAADRRRLLILITDGVPSPSANSDSQSSSGHFTQIVWANTRMSDDSADPDNIVDPEDDLLPPSGLDTASTKASDAFFVKCDSETTAPG